MICNADTLILPFVLLPDRLRRIVLLFLFRWLVSLLWVYRETGIPNLCR
nr:MAG TPA: hypothetical protein [Caudoviricetes sp.]